MRISLRHRRLGFGFGLMLGLLLTGPAAVAQSADAPAGWPDQLALLARALVSDSDDPAADDERLASLLSADLIVRQMGSSGYESAARLRQLTVGLMPIAARAYTWPATTVATDLAQDLGRCDSLPQAIRGQFCPRDDAQARRFNHVASQWMASVLQPQPGQLVGVIVLWEPLPPITTTLLLGTTPEPKQPLFVMVKAVADDDGTVRITHLVYGDVRQALS